MTKQIKPAFMPIKAEHDKERPKTKTQNKILIEHFVGGNDHKTGHKRTPQHITLQHKKKLLSLAKCSIVEKRKGSKEKWQKQKQSALKTLRKQDL